MNLFGMVRVAAVSPRLTVADPQKNVEEMLQQIASDGDLDSHIHEADVIVFPELSITGYSIRDLFQQRVLLDDAIRAVIYFAQELNSPRGRAAKGEALVFVGMPLEVEGELFNCAVAIHRGKIIGIVPKTHPLTYGEFEERRWFRSGRVAPFESGYVLPSDHPFSDVPFGTDLLFTTEYGLTVFAEVCEDLFMPVPPSSIACMHGANVIVNLSASPETVAKSEYRRDLVTGQSARCLAAYVYSSAGPSESTTDVVFSGHCLVAENGNLLNQSTYVGDGLGMLGPRHAAADIDIHLLQHERLRQQTFGDGKRLFPRTYRRIEWLPPHQHRIEEFRKPLRRIDPNPFVPKDPAKLKARCSSIVEIQVAGLVKRLQSAKVKEVTIGISGGLDSTLALLITLRAFKYLGLPTSGIKAFTMPGFGTTSKTKEIADHLMALTGVTSHEIDVRDPAFQIFRSMGHRAFGISFEDMEDRLGLGDSPAEAFSSVLHTLEREVIDKGDLVFENVQARLRTLLLMCKGFVIGTGDMSELVAGWCTYNGDHMSMYGVNGGVPKTLVRFLVRHIANVQTPAGELRDVLNKCADLQFSPELLPTPKGGEITQITEASIGPYELRDFFMLHMMRHGAGPAKTLWLAEQTTLAGDYSKEIRYKTMQSFITRLFSQQFKRSCLPDGPKVGTLSVSPRGDWRMPSDASPNSWLRDLERMKPS